MPGIGCFLVFGFVAYHYPARTGSSTPWTRDASRGSWIVTRWLPRIWADRRRNGRRTPRFRCVVPLLRSNEKIGPFMATYLSDFLFFFFLISCKCSSCLFGTLFLPLVFHASFSSSKWCLYYAIVNSLPLIRDEILGIRDWFSETAS